MMVELTLVESDLTHYREQAAKGDLVAKAKMAGFKLFGAGTNYDPEGAKKLLDEVLKKKRKLPKILYYNCIALLVFYYNNVKDDAMATEFHNTRLIKEIIKQPVSEWDFDFLQDAIDRAKVWQKLAG